MTSAGAAPGRSRSTQSCWASSSERVLLEHLRGGAAEHADPPHVGEVAARAAVLDDERELVAVLDDPVLVVADLELRGLTHRCRADHVDAALAAPLLAEALDLGREVGLAHPRPRDRERMVQRLVLQRRGRAQDLLLGRRFDRLDRVDQLARVDDLDITEAAGQMIEHRPRDLRRADDPDPPRPQRPQRIESQLGVVAVAGAHRGEARRRQHPPDAVQDRIVGRHRPVAADRPVDDRGHRLGRREHQRHRVAAAGRQPGEPARRATEAVDVAVDEQRVDLRVGHRRRARAPSVARAPPRAARHSRDRPSRPPSSLDSLPRPRRVRDPRAPPHRRAARRRATPRAGRAEPASARGRRSPSRRDGRHRRPSPPARLRSSRRPTALRRHQPRCARSPTHHPARHTTTRRRPATRAARGRRGRSTT